MFCANSLGGVPSAEVMGLVVLVVPYALHVDGVVIFNHVFHLFVRHLVRLYGRGKLTPELLLLRSILLFVLYSRLLVLLWLTVAHKLLVLVVIAQSILLLVLVEFL